MNRFDEAPYIAERRREERRFWLSIFVGLAAAIALIVWAVLGTK